MHKSTYAISSFHERGTSQISQISVEEHQVMSLESASVGLKNTSLKMEKMWGCGLLRAYERKIPAISSESQICRS